MNNSEIIVRQYQQAISNHDLENIRHLLHPQYSVIDTDGQRREGPQAGIDMLDKFYSAFPDLKIDARNIFVSAEEATLEYWFEGTHLGKFMNVDPTGKRISVPECAVYEVRENKIYSEHRYGDSSIMLKQLGLQTNQSMHA